jgi:hypothetical protein
MIFSAVFFGSRLEQLAMLAARHRVPASYQLGDSPPDHAELIGAEEMQRIIARGEDAEKRRPSRSYSTSRGIQSNSVSSPVLPSRVAMRPA